MHPSVFIICSDESGTSRRKMSNIPWNTACSLGNDCSESKTQRQAGRERERERERARARTRRGRAKEGQTEHKKRQRENWFPPLLGVPVLAAFNPSCSKAALKSYTIYPRQSIRVEGLLGTKKSRKARTKGSRSIQIQVLGTTHPSCRCIQYTPQKPSMRIFHRCCALCFNGGTWEWRSQEPDG